MITIIAGTNRRQSEALRFARFIEDILRGMGHEDLRFVALEDVPAEIYHPDMYESAGIHAELRRIHAECLLPAEKFIIVSPEYNGGMPGALKLFLDAVSVIDIKRTFGHKKACLIGVAAGRAGNLVGLHQLSSILNYLGTTVFPRLQPISRIGGLLGEQGELADEATRKVLTQQMRDFLAF